MSSFLESVFAGRSKVGKKWGQATSQKPSKAGVHMAKYLTPTPQKPSKLGMSLSNAVTMRKSSAGSYTAPSSSGTIKTSKRSATG